MSKGLYKKPIYSLISSLKKAGQRKMLALLNWEPDKINLETHTDVT